MVNIIPAAIQGTGGWGSSSPMGEDINQRIAEALMLQSFKPQEIKSPWQGAAEMSNAALAGLMYRKAMDRQMDTARGMASIYGVNVPQQSAGGGPLSGLLNMFGGGSKPPAPPVAAPPVASAPPSAPPPIASAPPSPQQTASAPDVAPPMPPNRPIASDGLPAPVPPADVPNSNGPLPPAIQSQIKQIEGFAPKAQWDYHQYTNGYGTRAKGPGEVIDQETANARFQDELWKAANFVDQVAPNAPEGVRDALSDLTFNTGTKWAQSGLGQLARSGNWGGVAQGIQAYNKAGGKVLPGLVARRQAEASWIQPPLPQTAPLPPPRPQDIQVASNDPNFMPGQQQPFGAPMGNGIPPVGGPTDPFPTAPMAQNAPQVPLPPPRPMMSPSTPPPGQMLNGQPWNFPAMTPMPPDVRGTPVPAPPPPPANPQGVPPNMAQAPVQLAQNAPGLPQGAMPPNAAPPPMPQGQAPQSDQFGRGYVFQLLQQEKARAAAQLQYAIQTRNPQLAAGAQNALMSINQQMIGMMTPQTLKSGPGDNYDIVALGPDGQYHKQTIISNQNGLLNADAQHDVGAQIASGVMPTELGLRATSGAGGLTYAQAQNAAAAERRAAGVAPTGREIVGQQGERQAYVTAQKSNATKQGLLEGIANEAQNLIPMAKGASDAVPRSQYPSLNAVINAWNEHTGDPNITRLHQVVFGLANLYSRAVNPQNPSDNGFRHALDTLSAYYNKGQFDAGVNLLEQDINAMTRGGAEAAQALRKQFESHQLPPAPQIPTRIPSQPAQSPQMGVSPAEAAAPISSKAQYDALPSGARYVAPDGSVRTKR